MPAKKRVPSDEPAPLSNAEVQALADKAMAVWESGVPDEAVDAHGAVWTFEPVRDAGSRLILRRYVRNADGDDELAGETQVSAMEFGADAAPAIVASRVLALAEPA